MKAVSNDLPNIDLTGNQKIAQDIVNDYVRNWVMARNGRSGFPKALRFILMGSPGAGKSYTTKAITEFLRNIIGLDYDDLIKQATPTGCASFQMAPGATTVHKLFGLFIRSKIGDLDERGLKLLAEKLKKKVDVY